MHMSQYYIIYNPLAGDQKNTLQSVERLKRLVQPIPSSSFDITRVTSYRRFFTGLPKEDKIMICGGDGTLNRFLNDTAELHVPNSIYYYATGLSNNFLRDIAAPKQLPIPISKYLKSLPYAVINGHRYSFLNGVGLGLDGYCCKVVLETMDKSQRPLIYSKIAAKGLLLHCEPASATITVDGESYQYDNVWMAAAMNGRYNCGGMMVAPDQNRLDPEHKLHLAILHNTNRLRACHVCTSLFKREHLHYPESIHIHSGHHITVEYGRPATIQVDGEVIENVSQYEAHIAH